MSDRYEIELRGCTSTPLADYLKGLGLIRLVARADRDLKAAWISQHLHLCTDLSPQDLADYLLRDYAPTPILAPWNGGSGFFAKDNKTALEAIASGKADRLSVFRDCLTHAEKALEGMEREVSPKDAEKFELLQRLRNSLPDAALDWLDAAVVLSGDNSRYPPLLGTGGNDGRLDFTNNFMQRLCEVMDPDSGQPTIESHAWLELSLQGEPAPGLAKSAIGQFAPGQVGGPNATIGYETKGRVNPWDFILMLEGALVFAAAAVRRNASDPDGVLSYPFTVRATSAGAGLLGPGDAGAARGELWMPLWPRPASYSEVRALLAEGRVAIGARPARDALDFVRAVHRLGGYRGVDRFERYGLLMRSGKAFLATPIERIQITANPQTDFIDDLEKDDWLGRFRRFASGDLAAQRFVTLRHRLENQLFELARRPPEPARVQGLLVLLGQIQEALSRSAKAHEAVRPVPRLSARWVEAADDATAVLRIARALAGLRGQRDHPLPLRSQLFAVHPRWNTWVEADLELRIETKRGAGMVSTLIALLARRLWLQGRLEMADKPLSSVAGAHTADLASFLCDGRLDDRLERLLPGLALCDIPACAESGAGAGTLPGAFALLRIVLFPDDTLRALGYLRSDEHLPVPPQMLSQLASGNAELTRRAIEGAWHRLRANGLTPRVERNALPRLAGLNPRRVAAALLIPMTFGATGSITRRLLEDDGGDESVSMLPPAQPPGWMAAESNARSEHP